MYTADELEIRCALAGSPRAEQLIACLEGEIAKRDARIDELESRYQRDVYGLNNEGDPIGGEPAGGYANDNARLRAELAAIKAQEPVAYIPVDRETGEEWHPVLKKGSGNICDYKPLYAAPVVSGRNTMDSGVCVTDCRSSDGVAVGIIDAVITLARVFNGREVTPAVEEALIDLRSDEDVISMISFTQVVSGQGVPDGWRDGYRAAMNSAASGARQLYVQHCHHHGVNGLLDRCKELEQSFIRDADALLTASPAAPAADAGIVDMYRHLQKVTPYRFKKIQDASITDGGDVMYFHKDRFDAALLADMAAHCAAKGVV